MRKLSNLYKTVLSINNSDELKALYLEEINLMNPNEQYSLLAKNAISYLSTFLENICASYEINYELSNEDYMVIESETYSSLDN